jgi:hypothetical protein
MTSEAAVMSKPVSRGIPSARDPRPTTMFLKARSFTSRTRRQVMLCLSTWKKSSFWWTWLSSMAESRLWAEVTACVSPVRWRLSISIGTTWLKPPPAAPPFMPNVGPIAGWRTATVALLPMWEKACPRPTVVVVLPSPSGVGVMAETTTYFAIGLSESSSMASSFIFATSLP